MQSLKMHAFFGITIPMLLTASDTEVNAIIESVSNGSAARQLASLYNEGEYLRALFNQSGRFRFIPDEKSSQAQRLIKFADFYIAYKEYLEKLEAGQDTTSEESLTGLDDLLPEEGSIDALAELGELSGLDGLDGLAGLAEDTNAFGGLAGLAEDTNAFGGLDDLAEDTNAFGGLDDLAEDTNAFGGLDDLISDSDALRNDNVGLDALSELELSADDSALDNLAIVEPAESFNSLLVAEDSDLFAGIDISSSGVITASKDDRTVNERLLNELAYDPQFYEKLKSGDFKFVSTRISNWEPVRLRTLRDIKFSSSELEEFKRIQGCIVSVEENLNKLKSESDGTSELTLIRINSLQSELDRMSKSSEVLKGKYQYYDDTLSKVLTDERKFIPNRLLADCITRDGKSYTMTPIEFKIMSSLYSLAFRYQDGETRLDYLLSRIKTVCERREFNQQKFLNYSFSDLSSKESNSRLIQFNNSFKRWISGFPKQDLIDVTKKSIEDCKALLKPDDYSDVPQLKALFVRENLDKPESSPERYILTGYSGVGSAVERIERSQSMISKLTLPGQAFDAELLRKLLYRVADTRMILNMVRTEESFVSIFKIWVFINKHPVTRVLGDLGVNETCTDQELYEMANRLGVLGFYVNSLKLFDRCCNVSVGITTVKNTVIRETSKPKLHENLRMIQRHLESSLRMIQYEVEPIDF